MAFASHCPGEYLIHIQGWTLSSRELWKHVASHHLPLHSGAVRSLYFRTINALCSLFRSGTVCYELNSGRVMGVRSLRRNNVYVSNILCEEHTFRNVFSRVISAYKIAMKMVVGTMTLMSV